MSQNCRKEAEGQDAIDGAAAEGADIVDGIKDMMFGSDEDGAAAAGGVSEVKWQIMSRISCNLRGQVTSNGDFQYNYDH